MLDDVWVDVEVLDDVLVEVEVLDAVLVDVEGLDDVLVDVEVLVTTSGHRVPFKHVLNVVPLLVTQTMHLFISK